MTKRLLISALSASLLVGTALSASAEPVFNRIASFPVPENLPEGTDKATETSSEIITASEDGMTLIYSDSPLGAIGFVDITDPKAPKGLGAVMFDGEPTSVAVLGDKAVVAVNTSQDYVDPAGKLVAVDIASRTAGTSCELGGQPDSVAVAPDGSFVTVAIENERDEDLNDGQIPQMPAGELVIVPVSGGDLDCGAIRHVALTGLAEIAGDDPEPEFVDVNSLGEIAVTLQENNHIVVVDGATGEVKSHFSAGSVDLEGIDTQADGKLDFSGSAEGVLREPDTIKWIDEERFVTANEGDYEGGSRGFTIFNKSGEVEYESGAGFEREVARIGHFPDKRAGKKGVEPEGLAVGSFDGEDFIFVLSERASVVGVYKVGEGDPELVQMLPSGIAPESAVVIAERNLIATANEVDLIADGGVRSHVMLYERAEGEVAYPQIVAADKDGAPIGFGALSGLTADPEVPGRLYAVNDSFFGGQPSIFVIDATQKPAVIEDVIRISRNGNPAQLLDLEGIAADGKGGFWLASEGRPERMISHGILHVGADGVIDQAIGIPDELGSRQRRFGFEGIAVDGEGDDMTLWMAVQREWADDEKGHVKLVAYKPKSKEWGAVTYPLDTVEAGWVGLSEITIHDGNAYIVERDNQIGAAAKLKKLYSVALDQLQPAALGGELPVVEKELVHDFLPDMKAQTNGYVVDKIEGFTIDADGQAYAVTDNDGIDDSSGETLFWKVELSKTN